MAFRSALGVDRWRSVRRTSVLQPGGSSGRRPAADTGERRQSVVTDARLVMQAKKANGIAKRCFDIVGAACGLVLLLPVFLTLYVLIRLQDGGPAFYGHKRIGRYGLPFKCWKFRSMVMNGDEVLADYLAKYPSAAAEWQANRKLIDDPRVTPIGAFIRKTSLDEFPQLWNVLKGEMSLIGPRPVVRAELDRYGRDRRYYLLVRPGITGLWQVSGRSDTSYEQRVSLDRRYLEDWTYLQDLSILVNTVPAVLKAEGAR
jgi:exopolysaccharide production protein ExoY